MDTKTKLVLNSEEMVCFCTFAKNADATKARLVEILERPVVTAIIEKGENAYNIFSDDVPGCYVTNSSLATAQIQFKECVKFHRDGIIEDDGEVPKALKGEYFIVFVIDESDYELLSK